MEFNTNFKENFASFQKLFRENFVNLQPNSDFVAGSSLPSHGLHQDFPNPHKFSVDSSFVLSPFCDPFDPFQVSCNEEIRQECTSNAPPSFPIHSSNCAVGELQIQLLSPLLQTSDLLTGSQDCTPSNSPQGKFTNVSLSEEVSCGTMNNRRQMNKNNENKKIMPTKQKKRGETKFRMGKGQWTTNEDGLLLKLVEEHGERQWSHIAQMLPGRVGKQCRERWHNHLKPNIKDKWSEEEDKILIEAHRQFGNRWAEIARRIPGRSENTIKNHWNATKRRRPKQSRTSDSVKSNNLLQTYINSLISTSDNADDDQEQNLLSDSILREVDAMMNSSPKPESSGSHLNSADQLVLTSGLGEEVADCSKVLPQGNSFLSMLTDAPAGSTVDTHRFKRGCHLR